MNLNKSSYLIGDNIYEFIPGRLRDVRIYRGLTQKDLGDNIKLSKQSISNYENEVNNLPSFDVLSKISSVLDFPIEFFMKPKNDLLNVGQVFFRSQAIPSKKKDMLIKRLEYLSSEVISFIEKYIYLPKVNLIEVDYKSEYTKHDIIQISKELRGLWNLGSEPIEDLMSIMLKNGCIIARLPLHSEKTDGYSCWINDRPYSLLNIEKNGSARCRFTLAHELGHIILHKSLKNNEDIKRREKEANFFASEFLFPSKKVIDEINYVTLDALLPTKIKWKVSIAAILRRCYDLELITDDRYTMLQKQISKRRWRAVEPLDDIIDVEKPKLFKEAFDLLIDNNILSKNNILKEIKFSQNELINICCLPQNYFEEKIDLKPKLKVIK